VSSAKKRRRATCSIPITERPRRHPYLVRALDAPHLPYAPEAENNSIPIDPGPAQFNAFYPQCSGHALVSFPEH